MDIVGPLPMVKGYKYVLTMIDRYTRWPEAVSIAGMADKTVVNASYSTWVARFCAPATVTTDRASQFETDFFNAITNLVDAQRVRTTAYHPASNGMIERWHRSLKSAIMCHENDSWIDILPTVLLGLRTSIKEDIKTATAELVYGTYLRLPGELVIDSARMEGQEVYSRNLRS
ncbi:uncharacterized protein LOC107263200 [Cephus cinctus]|uniref:Uncharacterized protein LOC107263200 n=1 Tax=Cephus cinctus TaxID=211228 RepID=A0AAJ7BGV3_CEPCN|nr:uncharacterized protein LOC107263200 [Cephus cinctus]